MKVYNKDKTKVLKSYDLEKGYLQDDELFIKHIVEEEQQEESHLELIKEYANGGKSYKRVIDKEYNPRKEYDETEKIQVYIPYTKDYLINKEIAQLKAYLQETDYIAIKFAEGIISKEEFVPTRNKRQEARYKINELEKELNK